MARKRRRSTAIFRAEVAMKAIRDRRAVTGGYGLTVQRHTVQGVRTPFAVRTACHAVQAAAPAPRQQLHALRPLASDTAFRGFGATRSVCVISLFRIMSSTSRALVATHTRK